MRKKAEIEKRRRETWYSVGALTKDIVDGMKVTNELEKKILDAFVRTQEVYREASHRRDAGAGAPLSGLAPETGKESGNGAPVDDDHSHLTAEDSAIRGNGSGGTKT